MSKRIEEKIQKIKKEGNEIKMQASEKVVSYIGAGFGVIASLAWNEAIKALIEYLFPLKQNGILAKFVYAGVMTLVLIFVTLYLVRIFKLNNENKIEK